MKRTIAQLASRSLTGVLVPAVLAFGVIACQQLPKQLGKGVVVEPGQTLENRNPSDVVVAPIEVAVEGLSVPTQELRESLVRGLIKRRYAPLSLEFVDQAGRIGSEGPMEAAYQPGTLNEEVVCQLIVHAWDASLWETRNAFDVDIEIKMIDPARPHGAPLWSGRLPGRFNYADQSIQFATEGAHFRASLDQLVAELLAVMPARETRPDLQ